MIQPAATSVHATGRTAMRAGGGHGAGGTAGLAFVALLGGGGADGDYPPAGTATADDAAATDRQDDAAAGSSSPAVPTATEADWLSLIYGGTGIAPPVDGQLGVQTATRSPSGSNGDASASAASEGAAAVAPSFAAPGQRSVLATAVSAPVQAEDADRRTSDDAPAGSAASSFPPLPSAAALSMATVETTRADAAPLPADAAGLSVFRGKAGTPLAAAIGETPSTAAPPADRASPLQSDRASLVATPSPTIAAALPDPTQASIAASSTARALPRGSDRASLAPTIAPDRTTKTEAGVASPALSSTRRPLPLESDRTSVARAPSSNAPGIPSTVTEADAGSPTIISPGTPPASLAAAAPVMAGAEPAAAEQASIATRRSPLVGVDLAGQSRPETVPAPDTRSPPIASSSTAAPAGEVFAAAIQAADRGQAGTRRNSDDASSQQVMALASASPVAGTVAATSGQGGATLDMRHSGWPGAMVEHIERLRDAADAADTRIRLVPDALGGIDVSLSRQADGVSVTLAADQPATRAMLADARPQLTELAQARGLRLADANVGGGQGFADGQRRPTPSFMPSTPASATTSSTDDRDPADSRVA